MDLTAMEVLNQCVKWTVEGQDILSMFYNFREHIGNPHSVALDYVADLADCNSDFETFLSQKNHLSPVLALQRDLVDDVMMEWPKMMDRFEQLCPNGSDFDYVNSIRRGVVLDDDIADYVSKVILS